MKKYVIVYITISFFTAIGAEPIKELTSETYAGKKEQFMVPEGWTVYEREGWIHFNRDKCDVPLVFVSEEMEPGFKGYKKSDFFKWNIQQWGSYDMNMLPWLFGVLFTHIQDPPYTQDRYITPLYVLDMFSRIFADYSKFGAAWPIFVCYMLSLVSRPGIFSSEFTQAVKNASISACFKACNEQLKKEKPVIEASCIKDVLPKARAILQKLPEYIPSDTLKAIKKEAIRGKSLRYKMHFQIKKEFLTAFVNDLLVLLNQDPRLRPVCNIKVMRGIRAKAEDPAFSGKVAGIIVLYIPFISGSNTKRHGIIKFFMKALWDRYKIVAVKQKIHNHVRPRGNVQVVDFIYIGAGEGMNKVWVQKLQERKPARWKNTVYTPDYSSYRLYPIDPRLLLND